MPITEKGLIYVLALVGIFFIKESYQDIQETKTHTTAQLTELRADVKAQLVATKDVVNRLDRLNARGEDLETTVRAIEGNVLYYAGISKSPKPNKVVLGINTPKGDKFKVESELADSK